MSPSVLKKVLSQFGSILCNFLSFEREDLKTERVITEQKNTNKHA